ncbi:pseudouridine synthase [Candidatus Entotheonella palauensis]|nr:pseudouridine synthase [Candidatus Entotheonella palauensis]
MEGIRLHKVIAQAGVASRRKAEELIAAGRVRVNGHTVTALGTMVDPQADAIVVNGQPLRTQVTRHYLLLHKPKGYVSTCEDDQGRPTVLDLIKRPPSRLFPVGRLDVNSEGVLLLTNDGVLANRLLHPRYQVPRVYVVKVQGAVSNQALTQLRQGMVLDDGKTLPVGVEMMRRVETNCTLRMTLYEGRYRQIHRMLEHCGPYRVKWLQRVAMGPLTLGDLPKGRSRRLEAFEVKRLQQACRVRKPGVKRHGT